MQELRAENARNGGANGVGESGTVGRRKQVKIALITREVEVANPGVVVLEEAILDGSLVV
jgi:hypothetical protein